MKLEHVFRLSVILLCLASFFLFYLTGDIEYSAELVNAMAWHGYNSQVPHWLTLSIVGPLQLSAIVMLSFNGIARNIFAFLSLIGLVITVFDGVAAYTAMEVFIVQLYYLASGVALTLAFTSLSERFKASSVAKKQ